MRYIVTKLIPVRSTTSSRVNPDAPRNDRSSAARRRSRAVGVWRLPGTAFLPRLALTTNASLHYYSSKGILDWTVLHTTSGGGGIRAASRPESGVHRGRTYQ